MMNIQLSFKYFKIIEIFNIKITQKEDYFARATCVVEAGKTLPSPGTEGVLEGEEIYFKGYLAGPPLTLNGNVQEIDLIARPLDFQEKLRNVQRESRIAPYWDPLWVKDPQNSEEIQDVHTSSLYCDRRSGLLMRSDWFEGRSTLVFKNNFFKKSLHCWKGAPPLRACTLTIKANWVQKEEGVENLAPAIRKLFTLRHVNTYTKDSFREKWPEAGTPLGRSGIFVLKSRLQEVTPPGLPRYSPPLVWGEGIEKSYRARRYWFKPTLWVRWQAHQRRKETLSFTLKQNFTLFAPEESTTHHSEVTLQNINPEPKSYSWCPETFYRKGVKVFYNTATYRCETEHTSGPLFEAGLWKFHKPFYTPLGHPARASFFLTERGYQAVDHGLERAKRILAKSARAFFVSFEAPWEEVKEVTTDTSVVLYDSRLPGKRIKGKVIEYSLHVKGETQEKYGKITLACSVGKGRREDSPPPPPQEIYCEEAYFPSAAPLRCTPSGLAYFRYDEQGPLQRVRAGPLLREATLIHSPEEQEQAMRELQTLSSPRFEKAFSLLPTRLKLYFKDLRTRETLEHLISLRLAVDWSAPEHLVIGN